MKSNTTLWLCACLVLGSCGLRAARGAETANEEHAARAAAQDRGEAPSTPTRIVGQIDESKLVTLRGNTHPLARPEYDRGAVDPQTALQKMILVLRRSPEQEAALEALMERQQDPASEDYHHWLEPAELGRWYGPSEADIAAISNWLENHGFTIDEATNSRMFILFSGTAGQVEKTFHTQIDRYTVNGQEHISNNADPSIPAALTPVVVGVWSLNDFFAEPQHVSLGNFKLDSKTRKWTPLDPEMIPRPQFTLGSGENAFELVSPYDFATIYNVLPLWNELIDGNGVTIAIAGRSDIELSDVATFRSAFGLPAHAPTIITNGADPGVPSAGDKVENTLDVEWSGAVAKNATIEFVTSASTNSSDGAALSAIYIIDNNVAPIMSYSYGICELFLGSTGNSAYSSLWQSGASEGISEFVASGDQGSAACDDNSKNETPFEASDGLAVSGISSTAYDVAVGGTDFQWLDIDGNDDLNTYWNPTNNASNLSSAKSYIPEIPWNSTCTNTIVVDLINAANSLDFDAEELCNAIVSEKVTSDYELVNVAGGTGGKSACTNPSGSTPSTCSGGWNKPTNWQTGPGVPNDGKRDVPDLSLFAANGILATAYVICDSATGPCDFSNANDAEAQGIGGTSVASPAMAGIMALIVQKVGKQGLPNTKFYQLAAKDTLSSCNSNTVAGNNSCVFYDITTNNNAMPCTVGDTNCTALHNGDKIGVLPGYNAGAGYDLATGLGSVNAYNLVNAFAGGSSSSGSVTLTPATVTFPDTPTGTTSEAQAVVVKNTSSSTVTIHSISITGTDPGSFVELNTCGASLAAGKSCTVFVAFKPAAAATETAKLSVSDSATGSPQAATMSGKGTAVDSVTLSATRLAFDTTDKGATSEAQTITVSNKGASTLSITGITITGSGASSFTELNTCGATLAANTSCAIDVAFKPGATGAFSATLNVADNGSHSPQTVALSGTGAP